MQHNYAEAAEILETFRDKASKTVKNPRSIKNFNPYGTGAYNLTSAAVKADDRTGELSFLVGVRNVAGGQQLLAGPYDGDLARIQARRGVR